MNNALETLYEYKDYFCEQQMECDKCIYVSKYNTCTLGNLIKELIYLEDQEQIEGCEK